MKHRAAIFLLLAFVGLLSAALPQMEKTAMLTLPPAIEAPKDLLLNVTFRWDEEVTVRVETVTIDGRVCTYGQLKVFSEDGKEMPMIYPVTMPLVPTGSMVGSKGQILRLGIYTLSSVQPLKPGSYYAIVTFSDAFCGTQKVRFTTTKRWFMVRNAKQKPA